MKVTTELLEEYVAFRRIAYAFADLFQLKEQELLHPNVASWLTDIVKQYQTAFMAMKAVKMRSSENTSIEGYKTRDNTPPPLPPKPSVLDDILKED